MINRGEGNSDKFTDIGVLKYHLDRNEANSVPTLKQIDRLEKEGSLNQ
jgi:hypothetical protein